MIKYSEYLVRKINDLDSLIVNSIQSVLMAFIVYCINLFLPIFMLYKKILPDESDYNLYLSMSVSLFFAGLFFISVFYFYFKKYLKNPIKENFISVIFIVFINTFYLFLLLSINVYLDHLVGKEKYFIYVTGVLCSFPFVAMILFFTSMWSENLKKIINEENYESSIFISPNQISLLSSNSGIYRIIDVTNNKFYIGRTKNFKKRLSQHFKELSNKKHVNYLLQKSYNDGSNFKIEIVEFFSKYNHVEMVMLEHLYIEKFKTRDRNFGYNLRD